MDDLFFNSFKFKLVGFSVGFYIVFCVRTLWSIYCCLLYTSDAADEL